MGNAQKKLGLKKSGNGNQIKDPKKPGSGSGRNLAKSSDFDDVDRSDDESLQDLLSKGPIEQFYEVHSNIVLGKGHYAVVNFGVCKRTNRQVAIKRIQINKSRVEALQREVHVLKKIGQHPNIVALYDIFITNNELQLVLELLKGGELFDRMVEKGPYSEKEASHHIRKIGQALQYLHRHGIVHRDLKPENLILADKSDDSELKIADFGLSKIVDDVANSTMQTVCGTWAYCAPEVKTSVSTAVHSQDPNSNQNNLACYTAAVDLWSVGVIMYVILGAYHPFDPDGDANDVQLWTRICAGKFDFNDPAWDSISESAKDLIKNLIVVDPKKRFTTDQLLAHPWVSLAASVPATPITPRIDKSLGGYTSHVRKVATPKFGGLNMGQTAAQNYYAQVHMHQQQGQMQNQIHNQTGPNGNQQFYQQQQQLGQQGFYQTNYQPQSIPHNNVNAYPQQYQAPPHPQFNQFESSLESSTSSGQKQPHIPTVSFNMNHQVYGGSPANPVGLQQLAPTSGFGAQQNPGVTLDTFINSFESDAIDVMDLVTPTAARTR